MTIRILFSQKLFLIFCSLDYIKSTVEPINNYQNVCHSANMFCTIFFLIFNKKFHKYNRNCNLKINIEFIRFVYTSHIWFGIFDVS